MKIRRREVGPPRAFAILTPIVAVLTASSAKVSRIQSRTRLISLFKVDTVCMDQSDMVEKTEQVRMMGDIYELAPTVLIWLGP
jgi:hypothetical protein